MLKIVTSLGDYDAAIKKVSWYINSYSEYFFLPIDEILNIGT